MISSSCGSKQALKCHMYLSRISGKLAIPIYPPVISKDGKSRVEKYLALKGHREVKVRLSSVEYVLDIYI